MTKRVRWEDLPLFADDMAIGAAILGTERAGEWKAGAALLEGAGLPKIDPRYGLRYTPAVRRFYDHEYGLTPSNPKRPSGTEKPEAYGTTGRRASRG